MCRNIRVLHDFEPPTSADEIRAAALQYVRKVGGLTHIGLKEQAAVEAATDEIARVTRVLLDALPKRKVPRSRELERERAKQRFARRVLG
jgi:hypothetical protein